MTTQILAFFFLKYWQMDNLPKGGCSGGGGQTRVPREKPRQPVRKLVSRICGNKSTVHGGNQARCTHIHVQCWKVVVSVIVFNIENELVS